MPSPRIHIYAPGPAQGRTLRRCQSVLSMLLALEMMLAVILPINAFTTPTTRRNAYSYARTSNIDLRVAMNGRSTDNGADFIPFHSILGSLQEQGVEIIGVECPDVTGFLAAIWNILAEASIKDEATSRCIIFENGKIPLSACASLEQDLASLQQQDRLMRHLPELQRITVSVLPGIANERSKLLDQENGRPALLIQTTARTEEELAERDQRAVFEDIFTEDKTTVAMKHFVTRMVQKESQGSTCPYTKSAEISGVGLESKGVRPGPVGYRFSASSDAVQAIATFWNCVEECLSKSEAELSTILLSLPSIAPGTEREALERFAAVVELISRNLCLFRGDGVFGLVHFHPAYHRDSIQPIDRPAYGHLPPTSWIRSMLRYGGAHIAEADRFTDADLACSDYQRRAPCTMINILRASQVDSAAGPKSIVDLDVGGGRIEKASGIVTYSRNAIRLASIGEVALAQQVDEEMLSMI